MIAEAGERGLRLDGARSEQDLLTPPRICPLVAQRPARALDPVQGQSGEAGLLDLRGQAGGGVEVGGGEELRPVRRNSRFEGQPGRCVRRFHVRILAGSVPITPGGLGTADAVYVAVMVAGGAPSSAAVAGDLVFRTLTYLLPIPVGA